MTTTGVEVSEIQPVRSMAAIALALAKAQGQYAPIPRSRTVTVKMKPKADGREGGTYTFSYAPLDVILEATRAALTANELALTQVLHGGGREPMMLRTVLFHSSGQFLSSEVALTAVGSSPQELGSAITYMRRYVITALLGVASEEDDDGNHASGNETRAAAPRAPKPTPQPPKDDITAKQRKTFAGLMAVPDVWTTEEKDVYTASETGITTGTDYQRMLDDLIAEGTKRKNSDPGAGA